MIDFKVYNAIIDKDKTLTRTVDYLEGHRERYHGWKYLTEG